MAAIAAAGSMSAIAQTDSLTIEGAEGGTYSATVWGDTLAVPLRIVSQGDKVITNVRVDASALRTPNNASVEPVVVQRDGMELPASEAFQVPALGSITLTLSAKVIETGVHRGSITLIYGGTRKSTSLAITRERPLPSVEVDPVPASTTDHLRLTLRETAGRSVELARPTLLPLVKVVATDVSEGAKYKLARVEQATGEKWTLVGNSLTVPPFGTVELRVTVEKLPRSGKFDGTLRFANVGDSGAVEAPVNFYRRLSVFVALVFLVLGGGLAEGLRSLGNRAARLTDLASVADRRERLANILRGLGPIPETDLRAVLNALAAAIADLYGRVSAATVPKGDLTPELTALDARMDLLRRWAYLRRQVPAALLPNVQNQLTTTANYLAGGGDAAAQTAAKTALDNVATSLAAYTPPAGVAGPSASSSGSATGGAGGSDVPSASNLKHQLTVIRYGSMAVGAFIAVLLGLLLLYEPNRTWGSSTDWLTMFLWALGVHQVAGVAASSTAQSLVNRIQSASTAA